MRTFAAAALVLLFAQTAFAVGNIRAAKYVAEHDPLCTSIQPFYWEIGSEKGVLASGTTGDGSVTRSSVFGIASASKWVFGAYVVQRENGKGDPITRKFLEMSAGYHSMRAMSCIFQPTVEACFKHGENSRYDPATDGRFYYNGGHFQKWGMDHGMGALDRQALSAECRRVLGQDIPFRFGPMQFAGGLKMSAQSYALFLQKILSGQLKIHDHLGENEICTLPSSCPGKAVRSPIPVAWHYSYGHWVEDDPSGDGAFSSAGALGFYPWIDRSKTYYGILSRHQFRRSRDGQRGAGYESALCGERIRKAFLK